MDKDLECPYCETMNDVPDDCHEENSHYEVECEKCGKNFGFNISYIPHYTGYVLPCANGEPHKYKHINGAPTEYFVDKFRCEYCEEKKTISAYKFYKEDNGNWYVDLPSWEGAKSDLLMIGGADTMLDYVSENSKEVRILISKEDFEGAHELVFKSLATDVGEGAYYLIEHWNGNAINLSVFLCDVTLFVLGEFPKSIFIKAAK